MSAVGSRTRKNAAETKAKIMAAAILGIAHRAYGVAAMAVEAAGLKEGRKARRSGRSAYYRNPADFYTHGSGTFLKNKRRGL